MNTSSRSYTKTVDLSDNEIVRLRTAIEERANSLTHAFAALLSVVGLIVMLGKVDQTNVAAVTSVWLYGSSMIFVFTASAFLHAYYDHKLTNLLDTLDHAGINLLIAGTYSPFLLLGVGEKTGWSFFWVIWGIAIGGVLWRMCMGERVRWVSLGIYILMGWLWVLELDALSDALQDGSYYLMLAVCLYMMGMVFYLWERLPFNHTVWHVFAMVGTFMTYYVIYNYIL
ncbi:hemolysin III family protein [Limibacter armeniacum]|uniref:PAQR family membrane homeostasis protein TrhA n=1 Tax=Limibacter armeniacum TaxID=466084 RepID=UPI002FE50144